MTNLRQEGSLAIFTRDGMASAGYIMNRQRNILQGFKYYDKRG